MRLLITFAVTLIFVLLWAKLFNRSLNRLYARRVGLFFFVVVSVVTATGALVYLFLEELFSVTLFVLFASALLFYILYLFALMFSKKRKSNKDDYLYGGTDYGHYQEQREKREQNEDSDDSTE